MRHQIEQSLGIKAYDVYGLTEITGPGVSYECSAQNGMHVCEDMFIPEIIDPDTEEVLLRVHSVNLFSQQLQKRVCR